MFLQSEVEIWGNFWVGVSAPVLAWSQCRQSLPGGGDRGGWGGDWAWQGRGGAGTGILHVIPHHWISCPYPAWPKQLFNHPGFSQEGNVFQGKTRLKKKSKSNSQHGKSLEDTPARQTLHGKRWVSSVLSKHSQSCTSLSLPGCPGTPWFQCPAGYQPFPWLIPSLQQAATIVFSSFSLGLSPQVYNTSANLQQKLIPECTKARFPLAAETLNKPQLYGDFDSLPQSFWSLQIKRWKIFCQSQTASNYTKTDKFFHQPTWIAWLD